MRTLFYILSVLVIILIGCSRKVDKSYFLRSNKQVITVTPSPKSDNLHQIVDSIKRQVLVPLETSHKSLISRISKIEFYNNHFYILDKASYSLMVFDKNGAFKFKISARGKGPKDFLVPSDFCIHPNDKSIVILDGELDKILFFDINNGTFQKSLNKIPPKFGAMSFLDEEIMIFQSFSRKNTCFYDVVKNNKIIGNFLPCPDGIPSIHIGTQFGFYNTKDGYLTKSIFNDTIYKVTTDSVYPKYYIDFGKNKFNTPSTRNFKEYIKTETQTVLSFNYYETDKFLEIDYIIDKKAYKAFYYPNTGDLIQGRQKTSDIKAVLLFGSISSFENCLISKISAHGVTELLKSVGFENFENSVSEEEYIKIANIKKDDNPVLVLNYF